MAVKINDFSTTAYLSGLRISALDTHDGAPGGQFLHKRSF